ncbi:MAG: hypothetical protein ACYDBB_26460 [Armatimonadota bacterium]
MSADATPRFSSHPTRRRWWWVVGLVLLVIAGVWWWRMPATLRVIARIPKGNPSYEDSRWTPLGLLRWTWTKGKDAPSQLTQYGWDGVERWSVQGPVGVGDMQWRERNLMYSPDGHFITIPLAGDTWVRLLRWHDGKALGEVRVPHVNGRYTFNVFPSVQVCNSGRTWVYTDGMETCPIWAVDGRRVAAGRIAASPVKMDPPIYGWYLSADGALLSMQPETSPLFIRFFTLAVEGDRVKAVQISLLRNARRFSMENGGLVWDGNGNLLRRSGAILNQPGWSSALLNGADGGVLLLTPKARGTAAVACRLHHLASGGQWEIRSFRPQVDALCGTADGRFALTRERGVQPGLRPFIHLVSHLPRGHTLAWRLVESEQLVLYERPGRPRAVFPISTSTQGTEYFDCTLNGMPYTGFCSVALSPDGRRVGVVLRAKGDKREWYVVLGR